MASIERVTETELEVREAPPPAQPPTPQAVDTAERVTRVTVIRPAQRWPRLDVAELWHYRELLGTFVWRDIKVRYKQTYIGVAWALLVPIFTATVYIVVFGKFAGFPSGNLPYPALVVSGILPMQYFASSLTGSSTSIVGSVNLVTKVYFPRVLLPLGAVLVPAIDFVIGLLVLIPLMGWYGLWPNGALAVLAVGFLAIGLVAALGLGLFLSAVNVRYRDVPYAIPVFLQVLPLLSAVPYALNRIPDKWQWILSINPMTAVISGFRWTMLGAAEPDAPKLAVSIVVAVLLFLGGLTFFRSSEPRFADRI
jgi:lipopolysaccharide transport system permease protein